MVGRVHRDATIDAYETWKTKYKSKVLPCQIEHDQELASFHKDFSHALMFEHAFVEWIIFHLLHNNGYASCIHIINHVNIPLDGRYEHTSVFHSVLSEHKDK